MALVRVVALLVVCLSLVANGRAATPIDDAMNDCCPDMPSALSSGDPSAAPTRPASGCCHADACHCAVAHGLVVVLPASRVAVPCLQVVTAGVAPTIDGHAPPVPEPLIRPPIG